MTCDMQSSKMGDNRKTLGEFTKLSKVGGEHDDRKLEETGRFAKEHKGPNWLKLVPGPVCYVKELIEIPIKSSFGSNPPTAVTSFTKVSRRRMKALIDDLLPNHRFDGKHMYGTSLADDPVTRQSVPRSNPDIVGSRSTLQPAFYGGGHPKPLIDQEVKTLKEGMIRFISNNSLSPVRSQKSKIRGK